MAETLSITNALMGGPSDDIVQSSLEFVRKHLDMDVAYLSEFVGDELVFRRLSAPSTELPVEVGDSMPLNEVYCPHVLSGRLPELIRDTSQEPFAQSLAVTQALPIGAHVSIPIKRADGTPYGMFCCLSTEAKPSLNERDVDVMRAFARLSSETINGTLSEAEIRKVTEGRIRAAMDEYGFSLVFQPIFSAQDRTITGFEALCRFAGEPYISPDRWFLDAATVGMQADLEICVIEKALSTLTDFDPDIYLSLNVSPATVQTGRLREVFRACPPDRIVLELTEHEAFTDYETLLIELDTLREAGIRIAIDDAGAGYAGLQQIVRLQPDIIKLDISLTSNIDTDIVRRSLAAALRTFAQDTHALIVAEGVETQGEFETLRAMSVDMMQGYLLGRPMALADAVAFRANQTAQAQPTAQAG